MTRQDENQVIVFECIICKGLFFSKYKDMVKHGQECQMCRDWGDDEIETLSREIDIEGRLEDWFGEGG